MLYCLRDESADPEPGVQYSWSVRIRGCLCDVCRVFLYGTVVHKTQLLSDSYWSCGVWTPCLLGPVSRIVWSPKAPLPPDYLFSTVVVVDAPWHQLVVDIVDLILPRIRIKETQRRIVRILTSNGVRIHFKWLCCCIFNCVTVKRIFHPRKWTYLKAIWWDSTRRCGQTSTLTV